MTKYYQIMIKSMPQYFYITINQIIYQFKIYWCETEYGGWVIDIYSGSGEPLVTGVAICCDTDIMQQYKHVCPFELICLSGNTYGPNQGQLGNTHALYYGV